MKQKLPAKRKVLRKKPAQFEIRLGDCIEGMRAMPNESVDVVMTSPPYNLGIKYSSYRDDQHRAAYLRFLIRS